MPARPAWSGTSRRLIVSFVLVLLVPAIAVVWLGVRLIEQDRALAVRQLRERRDSAADRLIAGFEQTLSATERRLASTDALPVHPDDDAVVLRVRPASIAAFPKDHLLYVPALPPDASDAADAFASGETLEFVANDYRASADAYRGLTASSSPSIRAGALLRLARASRKANRMDEALRAYEELSRMTDVRLSGLPADLVGRRAKCALLEEVGRAEDLTQEARALHADLMAARWTLDRGTFAAYIDQARRWAGNVPPIDTDREALSQAAAWIWQQWNDTPGTFKSASRRAARFGKINMTILAQPVGDGVDVLVAGPRFGQREWFETPRAIADARGLRVALADEGGQSADMERRAAAATRLPWDLYIGSADAAADLDEIGARRTLILTGLTLLVSIVGAGAYFILRAMSREFAVAQLQSDFVAAVSHEFRTPLTSLRQFTDLLSGNPDLPAAKRATFYEAQSRATERLRRLVESLLDFGRMEAGARPYRLEPRPAGPLVRSIVEDFQRDAAPAGFTIDLTIHDAGAEIAVDTEAFTRALWNLLDNAIKYSGSSRLVTVALDVEDARVVVRVRDKGLGIPRSEHERIFEKFVRGEASRAHRISGTGIGLAMVRHIVAAFGGSVAVESAPGQGSTFSIVLPVSST